MDPPTKRKLIVAGVASGLSVVAMSAGVTSQLSAASGLGAVAGTGVAIFLSVLVTEYLTDVLLH